MDSLYFIFMLFVLVCSAFLMLSQWADGDDSKRAIRSIHQEQSPARELTARELEILKANGTYCGIKLDKLLSLAVYEISGIYTRRSYAYHNCTLQSDFIGDVEVHLVFNSRDFLLHENKAEVLLGEKFAFVISLNDAYCLESGYQASPRYKGESSSGGIV